MDWTFIILTLVKIGGVVAVLFTLCAYSVLAERKVSAWIQDRVGPNRVGFPIISDLPLLGWTKRLALFQPAVDGIKAFLKEDFVPAHVNKFYFWLAPAISMAPALITIAVIPFGSEINGVKMVLADLNVGILHVFAIASLGVYGIVLAGWASNSKYPFLGAIRSSAQMISYEICLGLSVIPVFMIVGSLNLSEIIGYQANHCWLILVQFPSFLIFLISSFAETNRLPFDLPESETELVGGYHTEYSSVKFAMFFLAEYANMVTASALMVTLFFGGWTLPWFGLDQPATNIGMGVVHVLVFITKILFFMFLFIWVRWTLPRFRYDQLMRIGWNIFLPVALANIFITGLFMVWKYGN